MIRLREPLRVLASGRFRRVGGVQREVQVNKIDPYGCRPSSTAVDISRALKRVAKPPAVTALSGSEQGVRTIPVSGQ